MVLRINELVHCYEMGAITLQELFLRASEENLGEGLPESLQRDYEDWIKEHPVGVCRTFNIGSWVLVG